MNRFVRFGPLLVVLGLCIGFAVAFPAFLMAYVVQPVAVALWLLWRVVACVDLSTYWILLILLCLAGMMQVLPPGRHEAEGSTHGDKPVPVARIARWQGLLREAEKSSESETALRASLREMLEAIIGEADEANAAELEDSLRAKRIRLPEAARRYLFPADVRRNGTMRDRMQNAAAQIARSMRRLTGEPDDRRDEAVDELLRWMESIMEIQHDQ